MATKTFDPRQRTEATQPKASTTAERTATTHFDPAHNSASLPSVAVLHSALLFLMSRYARTGCIHLVEPIVQHLRLLESHPDIGDTDGPLQRTCRQLAGDWTELRYLRQLQTTPPDRLPATRH